MELWQGQITNFSLEYYAGIVIVMKKYQFIWVTQCKENIASTTNWVDFSLLTLVYQGTIQFLLTGWTNYATNSF